MMAIYKGKKSLRGVAVHSSIQARWDEPERTQMMAIYKGKKL